MNKQDYPTCRTCLHREVYTIDNYCNHKKLGESGEVYIDDNDDSLVYSYNEGGSFCVGLNFGCIHHSVNDNCK